MTTYESGIRRRDSFETGTCFASREGFGFDLGKRIARRDDARAIAAPSDQLPVAIQGGGWAVLLLGVIHVT